MRKVITYYAEDGTPFNNEFDCRKYEREQKEIQMDEVCRCAKQLDEKIRKQYHCAFLADIPLDYTNQEDEQIDFYKYPMRLGIDIAEILSDETIISDEDLEQKKNDIFKIIADSKYGSIIMEKWTMNKESIITAVSIRRNFLTALQDTKCGSDIASKLGYTFSRNDICKLAKIHKNNKYRRKIEDVLTTANFHSVCNMLCNQQYDKLLYEKV